MTIINITIIGSLVGVIGTGLGGFLVILLGKPSDKTLSAILGFAGGIMTSIIFMDLLPEAFEIGGLAPAIIGLIVGVLLIYVMDVFQPHEHFFDSSDANFRFIKAGVVLAIGIALHNIPEGLAIGAGYTANSQLGFYLALIILIQNIPEGVAMAAPLYIGGVNRFKVLYITMLSGLPMGLGALIGSAVGNISTYVLAGGLGFAAGAMTFIVFHEMIPSAYELKSGHAPALGAVGGIIVGILVSFLG